MVALSREARLHLVRENIKAAGPDGAKIKETTPPLGGIRQRDVALLLRAGEVEFVDDRVRLKAVTP